MSYADMEINGYPPEVLDVCKLHDKMLENGELDDYYGRVRDENGNPLEKKDANGNVIPGEYVYETVEAYFMKRRKQFTRIGRP